MKSVHLSLPKLLNCSSNIVQTRTLHLNIFIGFNYEIWRKQFSVHIIDTKYLTGGKSSTQHEVENSIHRFRFKDLLRDIS